MTRLNITKETFKSIMEKEGYKVQSEFKFCVDRKFRADFYIKKKTEHGEKEILIEYEGVAAAKSRHTSIIGYTKDCEKYNLAAILGYIVLRYTVINFDQVLDDIERIK